MRWTRRFALLAALAGAAAFSAPAALADGSSGSSTSCTGGYAGGVLTITCTTSTGTYICQATRLSFGSFTLLCTNGGQTVLSCTATLFPRPSLVCPIKL
jgi:hypothetical protein